MSKVKQKINQKDDRFSNRTQAKGLDNRASRRTAAAIARKGTTVKRK
mgnify:FL=1